MERIKKGLNIPARDASARRRAELAKIHVLAAQAGMDREVYEAILLRLANVTSAAALDAKGRQAVIDHLLHSTGQVDHGTAPHNRGSKPLLKKIEALLGAGGKPWAYGEAMARRICHKPRLAFCSDAELHKIVAALSYDAQRRQRRTEAPHA